MLNRFRNGFLLLEMLLGLGILSFFLPLFCTSFLQLQTHWTTTSQALTTYFNSRYFTDFLYKDLSQASSILSGTNSTLQFRSFDNTLITYSLSQGRFGRKEDASSVTYLYNSSPSLVRFSLQKTPLLSLQLFFSNNTTLTLVPISQIGVGL